MSLFSKYRPIGYQFKEPERISPTVARERRLTAMLEKDQRFRDVANFEMKLKELKAERSRVTIKTINENGGITRRQKAASIAAALSTYKETDFSDPIHRANYRDLRKAQQELEYAIGSGGGRKKVNPTGFDQRSYNPGQTETAQMRSGNAARMASFVKANFLPHFKMPTEVIPCIQRTAQREVMFAKGYGGRGYKSKKRRHWHSGVPC